MKWYYVLWIIFLDDSTTYTQKYKSLAECKSALLIIHEETENVTAGCLRRRVPPYDWEEK